VLVCVFVSHFEILSKKIIKVHHSESGRVDLLSNVENMGLWKKNEEADFFKNPV